MIKLLNKIVPLIAIIFTLLVGLLVVPILIDGISTRVNTIYGTTDEAIEKEPEPAVVIKKEVFTKEAVGSELAQIVAAHQLAVNTFRETGNGYYTIHLYGNIDALSAFLNDFGSSKMRPVIGDFMIKESSVYFYLMNMKTDSGQPLLFTAPFYDLVTPENQAVTNRIAKAVEEGCSDDYYLILTFFVNPPETEVEKVQDVTPEITPETPVSENSNMDDIADREPEIANEEINTDRADVNIEDEEIDNENDFSERIENTTDKPNRKVASGNNFREGDANV